RFFYANNISLKYYDQFYYEANFLGDDIYIGHLKSGKYEGACPDQSEANDITSSNKLPL
ncbi:unnamed protein product, partial [Brassica rapa subsp. narinosa]